MAFREKYLQPVSQIRCGNGLLHLGPNFRIARDTSATAEKQMSSGDSSSTLMLRVSSTAAKGTFTITVTGTSGSLQHATTITLTTHN